MRATGLRSIVRGDDLTNCSICSDLLGVLYMARIAAAA